VLFFGFGLATLTCDFGRGGEFSIFARRRSNFALSTRILTGMGVFYRCPLWTKRTQ